MLAPEVLVEKLGLDRVELRHELQRHERHVGDAFDGDGGFQAPWPRSAPR